MMSGCQGLGRGSDRDMWEGQGYVRGTIIMDTCHYTLVQTHKMYNNMSEA